MKSIRSRLTALFVFIFGSTLILLSVLGYRYFSEAQQNDFDAALFNHAVDIASTVDINLFGDVSVPLTTEPEADKVFPFSLRRSFMQVRDHEGAVLARSRNLGKQTLPLSKPDYLETLKHGVSFSTISFPKGKGEDSSTSYRLLSYVVSKPPLPEMILQVAAPLTFLDREKEEIRRLLFIAIPLVLAMATVGGLLLSWRAMKPVSLMAHKAEHIQIGNLSERIPVPATDDEVQHLALTFNQLLDRIEKSVSANQRFVADASHQLKTPLSILRGELDILIRKSRSAEETQAFLQSASQEIDSLSHVVESMLVLARIDSGAGTMETRPVRLDEIALEAVSRLERLARTKEIRLRLNLAQAPELQSGSDPRFETRGDPELLKTLLQNLLENAIKYSPEGSLVEIEILEELTELVMTVRDQGPGIPVDKLPKIFDRFYRENSTETSSLKGFGLGLPIAQTIAKAHQTQITVESRADGIATGTEFRVRIKKV